MSRPQRIQRKRTKGWRMPDGAVYVGRPARWGNPFRLPLVDLNTSLTLYANSARGIWTAHPVQHLTNGGVSHVYNEHRAWTRRIAGHPLEAIRSELAGRDLACWCPLDQPCHADVLLTLANGGSPSSTINPPTGNAHKGNS